MKMMRCTQRFSRARAIFSMPRYYLRCRAALAAADELCHSCAADAAITLDMHDRYATIRHVTIITAAIDFFAFTHADTFASSLPA